MPHRNLLARNLTTPNLGFLDPIQQPIQMPEQSCGSKRTDTIVATVGYLHSSTIASPSAGHGEYPATGPGQPPILIPRRAEPSWRSSLASVSLPSECASVSPVGRVTRCAGASCHGA